MNRRVLYSAIAIGITVILLALALSQITSKTPTVTGKSPAAPLSDELTEQQELAQSLALSDPRVQAYTYGRPSEVFGVAKIGLDYPASAESCLVSDCRQINIYNWDENAAVSVIVDLDNEEVLEVLHQVGVHPGINKRLADLAIEIALNEPQVVDILGFQPKAEDVHMAPVDADAPGSICEGDRLCVAPTFNMGDRILWVFVDLHAEEVAAIRWTIIHPDDERSTVSYPPEVGCPAAGSINRDGWVLNHDVTGTDGLGIYDISFMHKVVATSIKLPEWHADYGNSGFRDSTGCGGGGGGFPIYPYGETQVLDLLDDQQNEIGFEVVQDFRMSSWGQSCNYRYEQHVQFFNDGRFRVVSGAYGQGCGLNAIYRPVVRIDIAVDGDEGDSFAIWGGRYGWIDQATELYRTPYSGNEGPHSYSDEGYAWKVGDIMGSGYFIEPRRGQFKDDGRGDEPFIYVTQHNPAQGDADLGVFGACCNDNHQQGPDEFINGESISGENIVIWYVPQMITDAEDSGDGYYCWTLLTGGISGPTYPCFSGPMFVPFNSGVELFIPYAIKAEDS